MALGYSKYHLEEDRIGEGTYGWVSKYHNIETGQLVAIKTPKHLHWLSDKPPNYVTIFTRREIVTMNKVTHPNVMGSVEVFIPDDGLPRIVMPFMDGSLVMVFKDKNLHLTEPDIKCLSKQLFKGLEALHEQLFMHRDLSPQNVLICFQTGQLCISDFGMTREMGLQPMTAKVTTLWYRAPELLFGARKYFSAVDIWSAGCLFAEMFSRKAIFQGNCELSVLNKIFQKMGSPSETNWRDALSMPDFLRFFDYERSPIERWLRGISDYGRIFVDEILVLDPQKRPGAGDLLKKDFFTKKPKATKRLRLSGKLRHESPST
jgi:cyclin-dependent kinase 7